MPKEKTWQGWATRLSVRRIIVFALLFLAVKPASAIEPYRIRIVAHTSESQKPANPKEPEPPIVEWHQELKLPDDILNVNHTPTSRPLIFLVSLDLVGKVIAVRPIDGFSLYLKYAAEQISKSDFLPPLAGKTFVLLVNDPLEKRLDNWQLYRTETCKATSDLPTLYEVAALHIGRPIGLDENGGNDLASRCYKYILDRNPSSVAARSGVADLCFFAKESCAYGYLQSLIASNPEFIEARHDLASIQLWSHDDEAYIAALGEILALEIPLAERARLLSSQAFFLNRLNRIDDTIRVIKKLNASVSELLAIYPEAASSYYSDEMDYGLLEEAKGMEEDAINSYRLGASGAAMNRMLPDIVRYELDLGLARTLRKTGDSAGAQSLCDRWATRWKKLGPHRSLLSLGNIQGSVAGELQGRWEFSCGNAETGLQLIQQAAKKYPDSSAPYRALAQYYYSIGEIQKAREAKATADRLFAAPTSKRW